MVRSCINAYDESRKPPASPGSRNASGKCRRKLATLMAHPRGLSTPRATRVNTSKTKVFCETYVPRTELAHILHAKTEYMPNGLRVLPGRLGAKTPATHFFFVISTFVYNSLGAIGAIVSWSRARAINYPVICSYLSM